ncbi:hypothetical protein KI387_032263, partial [Taxus chinensis]
MESGHSINKMARMAAIIKVKYDGETRRINLKSADISYDCLKSKIYDIFKLNQLFDVNAVSLRYIDEDGAVITLADYDNFNEALRQELCPFRVEVSATPLPRQPKGIHFLGSLEAAA